MTLYYSNSHKNPTKKIKYDIATPSSTPNPVQAVANIVKKPLLPFTDVLKREKNETVNETVNEVAMNQTSRVSLGGEDMSLSIKRRYVLIMDRLENIENLLILVIIMLTIIMFKNFK